MIRLGPLAVDEKILDALSEDKLVVFAGAGVSMGPPSNLPSFAELAHDIGFGSGREVSPPFDRFLGQLHDQKIPVHERAAQRLTQPDSAPTSLHLDLLRLFRSADRVRLVTTNFDLHFETAAQTLYGKELEVYRAPALPHGSRFAGIVHVHGALPKDQELVLTDADFGRAYLTEGWARRFLVDVFRNYTVLFVGYSHDDTVMNYLARALPPDSVRGRFALTEQDGNWQLLGIQPMRFSMVDGPDKFKELNDGVARLADWAMRGALDWQSRMAEIGSRVPPADEEVISEVEQALREIHTTRFFVDAAKDAGWPKWLDARKQLEALFSDGKLEEKDWLLALWLSQHYAIEHAAEVFDLVAAHQIRLNPQFWFLLGREIGIDKDKEIKAADLRQWVSILLASANDNADRHVLMWLAERSAAAGEIHLSLMVFLAMAEHRLDLKPPFTWDGDDAVAERRRLNAECPLRADHWGLNEVWEKQLKPHLPLIAQPLLSGITSELEDIHRDYSAWGKASQAWDPVSYGRSAIEPSDQDEYPEAVDVLINASRDVLEFLAANDQVLLDAWLERLGKSEVSILRRLAIHAVADHPQNLADERLRWLLTHMGLHDTSAHHEIYRTVELAYPGSSPETRRTLVEAVLAKRVPDSDWRTAEEGTARVHFDWLSWLERADPTCPIVQTALAPIKAKYPEWGVSDHPDFTHYMTSGWAGPRSPWTVDEVLSKSPIDQLDDLLTFQGERFGGPNREGLIFTLQAACKQRQVWAFSLAETLRGRSLWDSDLWPAVFRGWQDGDLTLADWQAVLPMLGKPQLLSAHGRDIANLLFSLVRDKGKPFALDLIHEANTIALACWNMLIPEDDDKKIDDWLSSAINRPAGVIVEFWIYGLSLLMQGKTGTDRRLPDDYRQWFTMVVEDPTSNGGLGRSVLASQMGFLFGLDETWARQHLVPLFSHVKRETFDQTWDGFLTWGHLYPALVDALMPAFVSALPRLDEDLSRRRQRFTEFYTALIVFHVVDPRAQLLQELFKYGSPQDRLSFASHLGNFLRSMDPASRQQLWTHWLHDYWRDRLQAIPKPLDDAEIRTMRDWLPALGDAFPEAVSLALRSPTVPIEHARFIHQLKESDLVTRFQLDTAELIIYLTSCKPEYHAGDLAKVATRLTDIPPEVAHRLDEALAKIGVKRS